MKNIVLILAVAYAGYWFYDNQSGSELVGEWKVDVKPTMKKYYEKGITVDQEKAMRKFFGQSSMTITSNGKLHMQFPNRGGQFDYSVISVLDDGCFDLNISEMGDSIACLDNDKLSLKNKESGSTDYFKRIQQGA